MTQDIGPGKSPRSSDAAQVSDHVEKILALVTEWIDRGAKDPNVKVSKWTDSAHLRKARAASGSTQARFALGEEGATEETLMAFLDQTLQDSVNPWTHRFLDKLFSAPTALSPAIDMMTSSLNVTAAVSSASPALCLAEEDAVEALSRLLGWNAETCDGLTMPGGSASNVLAVQTALGNIFPSFKTEGMLGIVSDLQAQGRSGRGARPLLFTSAQSHYSYEKACLGCGLGLSSLVKVPCDSSGRMDIQELERLFDEASDNLDGKKTDAVAGFPFLIGATAGTTILGAFDDLEGITRAVQQRALRGKTWVHVDGSWGGPALFSKRSRRSLQGVEHADSMTINPHKVLNVTQQCSFALFRRGEHLTVNVTDAKYLFHGTGSGPPTREIMRRNPGSKTMGCARRPDAFKFYVAWLQSGTRGFGEHVDRGTEHARKVVEAVSGVETLELAHGMPASEDLFLNVNFRPCPSPTVKHRLESSLRAIAAESSVPLDELQSRLNSKATLYVHSALARDGIFLVDRAPLSHPHGSGYYTRLITHPNTAWETFSAVVSEIDRLGQQFYHSQALEGQEEASSQALQQLLAQEDD